MFKAFGTELRCPLPDFATSRGRGAESTALFVVVPVAPLAINR